MQIERVLSANAQEQDGKGSFDVPKEDEADLKDWAKTPK